MMLGIYPMMLGIYPLMFQYGSEWMHSLDVALTVFVQALVNFPAARFCIPERDGAGQHDSDNNQDYDKQHDTPPVLVAE
jgi:hypothetical protein